MVLPCVAMVAVSALVLAADRNVINSLDILIDILQTEITFPPIQDFNVEFERGLVRFETTHLYSSLCLGQNDVLCAKESQQRPSKSHHKGRVSIRVMHLLSTQRMFSECKVARCQIFRLYRATIHLGANLPLTLI